MDFIFYFILVWGGGGGGGTAMGVYKSLFLFLLLQPIPSCFLLIIFGMIGFFFFFGLSYFHAWNVYQVGI
jgi:hypothetical protein